nr:sugar transferase [Neoroseomonas alba]
MPRAKRRFDLLVGTAMLVTFLPMLLLTCLGILILEGRPVFYVSRRRLDAGPPKPVLKFRTMRRDAERIANRNTVPIANTRFLNLPPDSPLYTPIGRSIERLMLTEMPQLIHVISGRMSVVGNRPLPENVVAALSKEFPGVEARFLVRGGLTGPVQLIGRDRISDADRLELEIAYCRAVLAAYSPLLDLKILVYTVLSGISAHFRFTPEELGALLASHTEQKASMQPRMHQPLLGSAEKERPAEAAVPIPERRRARS